MTSCFSRISPASATRRPARRSSSGTDGVVKYAEQTATPKDLPNFAAIKTALAK
jgi:hypothetical protein